jgi:hypothetical protein
VKKISCIIFSHVARLVMQDLPTEQSATELIVSLTVNHEGYFPRTLSDIGASSCIMLEVYNFNDQMIEC